MRDPAHVPTWRGARPAHSCGGPSPGAAPETVGPRQVTGVNHPSPPLPGAEAERRRSEGKGPVFFRGPTPEPPLKPGRPPAPGSQGESSSPSAGAGTERQVTEVTADFSRGFPPESTPGAVAWTERQVAHVKNPVGPNAR